MEWEQVSFFQMFMGLAHSPDFGNVSHICCFASRSVVRGPSSHSRHLGLLFFANARFPVSQSAWRWYAGWYEVREIFEGS